MHSGPLFDIKRLNAFYLRKNALYLSPIQLDQFSMVLIKKSECADKILRTWLTRGKFLNSAAVQKRNIAVFSSRGFV